MNKYLTRIKWQQQSNHHGRVSERKNIKDVGGWQTPASGSLPGAKSDGYSPTFQYENKSTLANSKSITMKVLAKITHEARSVGRIPIVLLSFVIQ